MPSARRRPEPQRLTFFIDRGLGKRHVPDVFRSAGHHVVLMAEVYAADGQFVGDDEWIRDASEAGWVALTKDVSVMRAHRDALAGSTLRVFALPNASLTGIQMADRFERNLHRIIQRSRHPGPFLDVVHPARLERRWSW